MKRNILSLRPTQFSVGMLEVDEKIAEVSKFSKAQKARYVKDNPIPVIISPIGEMYLTDHHHFLAVCLNVGIRKVRVKVIEDLSKTKMSYRQFWKWMRKKKYLYLFCQFGEGPRHALYLPNDIRGVADDPYRSLAWFVRKSGAYENSDRNYAEFRWANFFRAKKLLEKEGKRGFEAAMKKAMRLARSTSASHLPGFVGKSERKA